MPSIETQGNTSSQNMTAATPEAPAPVQVAVVDDEVGNQVMLRQYFMINFANVVVRMFANGHVYKESVEGGYQPDVIALDLRMPRMDGNQVLDWQKGSKPELNPKTIVMSGSVEKIATVTEREIAGKLLRPFLMHDLTKTITDKFPDKLQLKQRR